MKAGQIPVECRNGFPKWALPAFICLMLACSGSSQKQTPLNPSGPNILLLVADDLGYTDLGCYGGDIETPIIDSLAAHGIRFSRFHTAPMCAPTRAMLLTGTDNHIAGMGRQNLQAHVFGYEGELSTRVATLPELLQAAGYHTYMAGKWHLGSAPAANPHTKGFERSFVLLEGVGNHYSGKGIFKGTGQSHYTEDGEAVSWPEGRYSTDLYTDKLISYIDSGKQDHRPFFAYAAFTSPHWPLQVDPSFRKKYEGRYDDGYEALRARRLQSAIAQGLVREDAILPPLHPLVKPWDSLSASEKIRESRKMELYAGMLDNLDENIGRLISHLKETGVYENTLILFMSDNGAAGEDYFNEESIKPYINPVYDNTLENMGTENSLVSYGPQWAEAGTSPFRYYKEYTSGGGIIAPMILAGPMVAAKNSTYRGLATVMDIAPTFYELVGITYPDQWKGHALFPLEGTSMLGFLSGHSPEIHSPGYGFGLEHSGYTMYQKGDWKINSFTIPFDEGNFELYQLSTDPGESRDLRQEYPAKYEELLQDWADFVRKKRIQLPRE